MNKDQVKSTKDMPIQYIIVKHAGSSWKAHFDKDPKISPVHLGYSAAYSYSGKSAGVKLSYFNPAKAQADCKKLNASNPVGDYAVCVLLDR